MTDQPPNADAGAIRGVIGAADFHVTLAQGAIVAHVAAGAEFSDEQRAAARELAELSREASELVGQQRLATDEQLLERAHEFKSRADEVVDRADELRVLFFPDLDPEDGTSVAGEPAIDVAVDALLEAALTVGEVLCCDVPLEPDDLLWAAQRLANTVEEIQGLFEELGDRAASWRDTVNSFGPGVIGLTPAAERTYRAHLSDSPHRLHAAARALQLATRRGHLVELEAFRRPPQTRLRVAGSWIDVTLIDEAQERYRVRVAGAPGGDPTVPGVPAGELVQAIAAAVGLELADVDQRRQARDAADRARRELSAIVAYRNSGQRGDPQHAARLALLGDHGEIRIPYSHRPDSAQDLVDVLLDLYAERWPAASILRDSLAAVARTLDEDSERGIDRLLSHPNEDEAAAELVRALVEAWAAAALEHQARRLRDPEQLRRTLLATVLRLHAEGRPATIANLHAATARLVSRDDVSDAIIRLEADGLLEREDPLASRIVVFQLTAEGRVVAEASPAP